MGCFDGRVLGFACRDGGFKGFSSSGFGIWGSGLMLKSRTKTAVAEKALNGFRVWKRAVTRVDAFP